MPETKEPVPNKELTHKRIRWFHKTLVFLYAYNVSVSFEIAAGTGHSYNYYPGHSKQLSAAPDPCLYQQPGLASE